MNNIGDLFLATQRVSMDLDGDPNIFFVARLLFGTLDFVASRIPPMQDYTALGTAEVVSFLPSSVQGVLAPLYLNIFLAAFLGGSWSLKFDAITRSILQAVGGYRDYESVYSPEYG